MSDSIDQMLADDMASFFADPLGFVMYAYPWDSDQSIQVVKLQEPWATKYGLEFGPDDWACRFLDDLGKKVESNGFDGSSPVDPVRMAVTSGHGVGKSAMTGWIVDWIMSTRPFCQGTITANTSTQLETKTWAQIAKWTKLCVTGRWFDVNTGRGSMKMSRIGHAESWFCSAQTCREENSEAFAGQHAASSTSFYINDEASAVPDKIFEVQEGGLTDGEPMQFKFGNPTRNTGRFRECWRKFRHRWETYEIDSRDVQITNKDYLQGMIDDNGVDSDLVKVRVRGIFPSQSVKQFISEDDVDAAYGRFMREESFSFAPVILGVDPAWSGDDEFVVWMRQGNYSQKLFVAAKNDNDVHMANIIARLQDEYKAVCVNVDLGYGTGIVSAATTMGRQWNLVSFAGKPLDIGCLNKRAEMWKEMRDWLKAGGALPEDDVIRTDLTSPETVPRVDGKLQLESKESMKKRGVPSPNRADALALTFATQVYSPAEDYLGSQQDQVISEFDPFA